MKTLSWKANPRIIHVFQFGYRTLLVFGKKVYNDKSFVEAFVSEQGFEQ